MPDFMPVLIIAIILFTILLIVFGGGIVPFNPNQRPVHFPEERTIEFGGFDASYTASEVNTANMNGEVSNGLFEKNDERIGFIAMNPEQVSEGLMSLKVSDSNFYGRMFITINGKQVYSDYPAVGEILIAFDPSILQENNVVDVRAESSAWRIWAPTIYDFSFEVKLDYTGRRSKSFIFELSDSEKQYMTNARIVALGNRTGVGDLVVTVNGVVVASGVTTLYHDFGTDVLRAGNNTIEFSTESNTTYRISTSQLIVFFE